MAEGTTAYRSELARWSTLFSSDNEISDDIYDPTDTMGSALYLLADVTRPREASSE